MEIQITIKHNELENTRRYVADEGDWNERVQSLIEDFTDFLKDHQADEIPGFEGAREALSDLKI
jgi:hypothetical protein